MGIKMTLHQLIYLFIANLIIGFCVVFDIDRKNWREAIVKALLFSFLGDLVVILNSNFLPWVAQEVSEVNSILGSWLSDQSVTFFTILLIIATVFFIVKFCLGKRKK